MSTLKTTPLNRAHHAAGGKMVDFAGWELPVHYGSQLQEHEAVRNNAGVFDVSHMLISDIQGADAQAFLRKLAANDIAKLGKVGKALYSAMLNEQGGVIDDIIIYRMSEDCTRYRIVSNGATREKDLAHFQKVAGGLAVGITPRYDLAMLAVQGPQAIDKLLNMKPEWTDAVRALTAFQGADVGGDWFVTRTGYTGEEGVEVMLPEAQAEAFFQALLAAGVQACGLGARDTLRLEAGMNLYGNDMDDDTSPLEAGMAWTVDLKDENRDFVGKSALLALKQRGLAMKQVGLLLAKGGVLRDGMTVITEAGEGLTTSGAFSPSLKQSIAIARVPASFAGNEAKVLMRGKEVAVRVLPLPFVRNGKAMFE